MAAVSRIDPGGDLRWRHVAVAVAIVGAAALALLGMGRTLFCTCGRIALWTSEAWGPQNSQQLADPYTFTHVLHGALLYAALRLVAGGRPLPVRGLIAVFAESAWEVFENTDFVIERYRAATMALGYYGDSVLNSVGDILTCAGGFALAAILPVRATLALCIGIETVLALTIRDGLLLNLLMLVCPIDAVRSWQLGP
jgi:hypothetical protein